MEKITQAELQPFIEPTAVGEQKNLIMMSDDMPDAFWAINFSPDEMINYAFTAFKGKDLNGNGNGDDDDEYPIYLVTDLIGQVEQLLCGSYGIGNNGEQPLAQQYYLDESGVPQYLYTSDGMKQIWQLFAGWWSKGYMHPDTFGTTDYEKWATAGMNGQVGFFTWVTKNYLYSDAWKDYTSISVLQGPDSSIKPVMSWTDYPIRENGSFCITNACKDPETLMKWGDYFYTEEGMNFSWFGIEGETYELNGGGKPVFIDEIKNYEQGAQLGHSSTASYATAASQPAFPRAWRPRSPAVWISPAPAASASPTMMTVKNIAPRI